MRQNPLRVNTLFNEFLEVVPPTKQRKGRSDTFDAERNKLLVTRYYYYLKTTGFRFDLLMKIISKQFCLAERTVNNVISENLDILKEIRAKQPTKEELQAEWPFLSWDAPDLDYYRKH